MLIWVEQVPLLLAVGTADVDVPPEMVLDFYEDCLTDRGLLPLYLPRRQLAGKGEGWRGIQGDLRAQQRTIFDAWQEHECGRV